MSDKMPEFLAEKQAEDSAEGINAKLAELEEMAMRYHDLTKKIEMAEETLTVLKESAKQLGGDEIPMFLNTYGLSEVRLKNGMKVVVKDDVSASIPDEKQAKFFDFLKQRNEEDIIKLQVAFDRMPQEKLDDLLTFLTEYEYPYDMKKGVHPQTLKKYFKELLGINDANQAEGIAKGKYLRKEDIAEVANVFTYYKTTVK